MKKVITYGTFDLLHHGHVNLLRRAKELGDYLIVGVTSSDFDKNRGKINVKQSLMDRIEAVKALGIADEVIPEEYYGQKIDDIRNYDVDIFAIGSDWRGHFDYLNEYCEVVYLDRTEGISSTQLARRRPSHRPGHRGRLARHRQVHRRVQVRERCRCSGGVPRQRRIRPSGKDGAVRIAREAHRGKRRAVRRQRSRAPLRHGEGGVGGRQRRAERIAVALAASEAEALFAVADERGLVFHEAVKTAYALAFSRLTLLVKSGMIGSPVSVRATCTSQAFTSPAGSLIGWGPIACLPIFEMLGTDYTAASAASLMSRTDGTDVYTKVDFIYPGACASIEVGSGAKSEGELVIAGTKGYVYVPSPWWKTDYFEVRFEDFSSNKRYFYQLNGEGIRDEISVFAKTIQDGKKPNLDITRDHTIALSRLIENYRNGQMQVYNLGTESEGCSISFFQN